MIIIIIQQIRLACSRREAPEISSIQSLSNTSVMLVWQVASLIMIVIIIDIMMLWRKVQ